MKPKILFIGDSITRGVCGVNYVDIIKERNPDWNCVNRGVNGDTLVGITNRLMTILRKEKTGKEKWSAIVLEAGHNDLVFPEVRNQSALKKAYVLAMEKRGSRPTDISGFEEELEKRLRLIKRMTGAKIFLTTLSCLGEKISSDLNKQRRVVSGIIKRTGKKLGIEVIDVGKEFDNVLRKSASSGYFLDNPFTLITDLARSRHHVWIDRECQDKGLVLTIDGGHLNGRGAEIYASKIGEVLRKKIK